MTHIMVDLETFGTKPGCVIRSIGAVPFDPAGGCPFDQAAGLVRRDLAFYANIDRASCEAVGLTIDPSTEAWWEKQGDAAKTALTTNPLPLHHVLRLFAEWWDANSGSRFWANDPDFDAAILSAAYAATGIAQPWKYAAARSCRTMAELTGIKPDRTNGIHHTALDDAINQASAVIDAYAALKIGAAA